MPPLLVLEAVRKAYGTRVLMESVSAGVFDGDRIGVVGRNGSGKTSLLEVMAGAVQPDAGRVVRSGDVSVGVLAQADDLNSTWTVRDSVVGDRPEHEWAGDARIRDVMSGLLGGVAAPSLPAGLDGVVGSMSGGERRRVALTRLLVSSPDVVLLDEPTNHLDIEGVDWLARHLAAHRGALVVVTHDRWFLDAVATRTWELVDGRVEGYDGGYAAYVLARAERARVAAMDEARRQNLLRKELAWLRRGPPARTSKPRFRIDAANALIADMPAPRDSVDLVRFATARLGRQVIEMTSVDLRLGGRTVLSDVSWDLGPGDRAGIIGVNGSGKTSLLRLLASELSPSAGAVRRGQTVRLAHLSQEVTELDGALRALEAVEQVGRFVDLGQGQTLSAASLAERFGFGGDRQWTPVSDLSGGERRRLQLMRLLMASPNVLLLDEPTNDLDLDTLTALEDLLDGWAGTLVVVSHDRYFVERVCDRTYALLGDGRLRDLPGGIEEYVSLRRALVEARVLPPEKPRRRADPRAARKELARIERRLDRLAEEEQALHAELTAHATDHERVLRLDERLRALAAEQALLEDAWLALADR
ncbi:MAG: ABC-F family ATP-binding cassette domain-containing protein [Candidatus Nanopelagicales bacterium]